MPASTLKTRLEGPAVSRAQIVARGLRHRCPNCGEATLFKKGTFLGVEPACSHCGMRWDKDEAAFLGSLTLNYGITAFGFVLPGIIIGLAFDWPVFWLIVAAAIVSLLVPLILYRPTKSWWLMCYYTLLPEHLPANWACLPQGEPPPDE